MRQDRSTQSFASVCNALCAHDGMCDGAQSSTNSKVNLETDVFDDSNHLLLDALFDDLCRL